MKRSGASLSALFLVLTFVNGVAHAGLPHVDCGAPLVFPEAGVNVVFLPFATASGSSDNRNRFFTDISLLMQVNTLLHILPYRSVAAVQLDPPLLPGDSCTIESVSAKLMSKKPVGPQVKPGHGLILVSGLLYQEGADYYLKTFITFLRRDTSEQIGFDLGELVLSGGPSTQSVAFQPRHITQEQLDLLKSAYNESNLVRPTPSPNAVGTPLPTPLEKGTRGYQVTEAQNGWFHIRWIRSRRAGGINQGDGWILAEPRIAGVPIEDVLPELYFIRGVVGYLIARSSTSSADGVSAQTLSVLSRDFELYIAKEADNDDETVALAHEFRGLSRAAAGEADEASLDFENAIPLNPSSGGLRNLHACIEIWREWRAAQRPSSSFHLDGKAAVRELQSAIALNPADRSTPRNLYTFYSAVQKGMLVNSGLSSKEVQVGLRELRPPPRR